MEHSGNMDIMPGDRVYVSEHLYKNDVDTPRCSLLRPGTVTKRYGLLPYSIGDLYLGHYPDLVDILMDEDRPTGDRICTAVFTESVEKKDNIRNFSGPGMRMISRPNGVGAIEVVG